MKKEVSYKKVTVKGTMEASSTTVKLDVEFTLKDGKWDMTKGDAITGIAALVFVEETADLVLEDSKTTYYAGNGFKTVSKDDDTTSTLTWNANARLTSAKGKTDGAKVDVKLSWSK